MTGYPKEWLNNNLKKDKTMTPHEELADIVDGILDHLTTSQERLTIAQDQILKQRTEMNRLKRRVCDLEMGKNKNQETVAMLDMLV